MNKFYTAKRFRYGSAATAFTCAFIAVVILFNVAFTALASKYMWYIDMTKEEVFTLSEAAKNLLADVDAPVNIYFASEPDELMEGTYSPYMKYIYTTALQLQNEFDNINVECKDVVKHRAFFEPFRTTAATNIQTTSVVVESGGEVRVYAYNAFFYYDETTNQLWAYNGEYKLVSGILQVTSAELPIVYFTTQHGEDLGAEANAIHALFKDNGFDVRTIDLASEEIDDDARIVVINNPVYDFIGAEADSEFSNEIAKLDAFLDRLGCLIVFSSPDNAGRLTNLSEFLEEWGIAFTPNTYVKDMAHSVSTDGTSVVAAYDADTLGSSLYKDITSNLITPPKTVSPYTTPIEVLWETGGDLSGTREVSPILKSYDTAVAVKDGEEIGSGEYNLMTVSRELRLINNDYYSAYVVAIGSPDFAAANYLVSNAYANNDILSAIMRGTGRDKILADIPLKVFDNTELTITTAQANNWTVGLVTVLPLFAAAVGLVIWVRRKHS